jgi:Protein of unknown function (DUF3300)
MKSSTWSAAIFAWSTLAVAMSACSAQPVIEAPVVSTALPAADDAAYVAQTSDTAPTKVMQRPSDQLLQLTAPIALYPDGLVAEVLTASTYPTEVVEAWRWMQQRPGLEGKALADAANTQAWDPSVKALTQFPSVLDNMNENLSWTSALGDAYATEPDDVMNAIQVLRQRAHAAGKLETTSEQTVSTQGQTIDIEPSNPDIVYVPAYDPWLVYGAPLDAYPDWVSVPGVFYEGPDLDFGAGFDIGLFAGSAWGWQDWGFDWHRHAVLYHHAPYVSHSPTFALLHDRHYAAPHLNQHAGEPLGHRLDRPGMPLARAPLERSVTPAPQDRGIPLASLDRSVTQSIQLPVVHAEPGFRPGAFSGFDHGGIVGGYSARGHESFGAPVHLGYAARGFGEGGVHEGGSREGGFHDGGFQGGGFHGGAGHR